MLDEFSRHAFPPHQVAFEIVNEPGNFGTWHVSNRATDMTGITSMGPPSLTPLPLDVTRGRYDFHDEVAMFCGAGCTQRPWGVKGQYSTNLFSARAVETIAAHDTSKPLFLYLAYQAYGLTWLGLT
jgi:hypothetical protein